MEITLIEKPMHSCSMKDCKCQQGNYYIQIDNAFAIESETDSFHHLREDQGIVSQFETNFRDQPTLRGNVLGQLYYKEVVTLKEQKEHWLYVETAQKSGWVHEASIEHSSAVLAREQLAGETHRTILCVACLNKLNWEKFYVQEIEPNLQQHVVNNLLLSYLEYGATLEKELEEGEFIPYEELEARIIEQIEAGEHGDPLRLNKEQILRNTIVKRA